MATGAFAAVVWVLAEAPAQLQTDGSYTFQEHAPISAWRPVQAFQTKAECEARRGYLKKLEREATADPPQLHIKKRFLSHGEAIFEPDPTPDTRTPPPVRTPPTLTPMRCILSESQR